MNLFRNVKSKHFSNVNLDQFFFSIPSVQHTCTFDAIFSKNLERSSETRHTIDHPRTNSNVNGDYRVEA